MAETVNNIMYIFSYRMFSPMLIQLLLGFACESTFRTRIWPFSSMIHLMLLQLPFGTKHLQKFMSYDNSLIWYQQKYRHLYNEGRIQSNLYLLAYVALFGVFCIVYFQMQPKRSQFLKTFFTLWALEYSLRRMYLQKYCKNVDQ